MPGGIVAEHGRQSAEARSVRTGVASYVEHSLLDEQTIRALAEAADLLEIKP